MKKLLYFAFLSFFAFFGAVNAETETLNWVVDGQTYTTTTCESGGDIILSNPPSKPGYVFRGWRLGYTPIEYIESTGTQYIDTGYAIAYETNSGFDIKYNMTKLERDKGLIGAQNAADKNWFFNLYSLNNANFSFFIGRSGPVLTLEQKTNTIKELSCTANNNSWQCTTNNQIYHGSYDGTIISGQNIYFFSIGAPQTNISISRIVSARIYYVKIYDNNLLVRDFIPVLDQNGVACMYDRVTNQFFYNAGTGQFIAGPAISE